MRTCRDRSGLSIGAICMRILLRRVVVNSANFEDSALMKGLMPLVPYNATEIPASSTVSYKFPLAPDTPTSESHATETLYDLISPFAVRLILNKLLRHKHFCPCIFLVVVRRLLQVFREF